MSEPRKAGPVRATLPRRSPRLYGEAHFRWRGGDVSRMEALSDAVFALALTLLIIADVPRSFDDLALAFRQLPVFAVCFLLLVMCWWYHYKFHRRYGLEDFGTSLLNIALLFAVLFYVYPLKYLFTLLFWMFFDLRADVEFPSGDEWPTLMMLYSAGLVSIFAIFAALNLRAWSLREELELDPVEIEITRATTVSHLISVGIGMLSFGICVVDPSLYGLSGWVYFLMGPLQGLHGFWSGARVDRMVADSSGDER